MSENGPLKIDLHAIIRSRMRGVKGKLLPGFVISALERLVRQKELNDVLQVTYPKKGVAFCRAVYDHFNLHLTVEGTENIPKGKRLMFVSNHPLGGLDGLGVIKALGEFYPDSQMRFLVNDVLMNVKPLDEIFLPINKFGAQGRAAAIAINQAYASDAQIIQFPAGLVSRLGDDGRIADLEWQKAFVVKAVEFQRDIVPMKFVGENRGLFYKTARIRKKLGFKFNIEQILLPAELCESRGKSFRLIIGKPVPWEEIARKINAGMAPKSIAADIREKVIDIPS